MEMRKKLSSKNNKAKVQPKPAPTINLENFPKLITKPWSFRPNPIFTKSSTASNVASNDISSKDTSTSNANSIEATDKRHPWSFVHEKPNVHPSWVTNCGKLFSPEEIGPIFRDLTTNLKGCLNREEQLEVMFEIAAKYIYNGKP